MPSDIPDELRILIFDEVQASSFNRYPEPYAVTLRTKLAAWYGCSPGQILVGPGSSSFIRLLLTYFGLHMKGRLVITRPSFSYYEQFCAAFGINYDTWELDENFQYDPADLDEVPDYSVIFLTSPNNPTGSVLAPDSLKSLLFRHPKSLFIVDEAYAEFTAQAMLPLLNEHDNVILLRTFSKSWSAPSIRCGALIAPEPLARALAHLQTPWQLSAFTIDAAKVMIDYLQRTNWVNERVDSLISEREKLFKDCSRLAGAAFTVYPSQANFLLLKATSLEAHVAILKACTEHSVLVGDMHNLPRLAHCIRVTIGTPEENRLFLAAFKKTTQKLALRTLPR